MLLAMQRAVFIKAMPLRALGATGEQATAICADIERRVPELVDRHSALLHSDCDRASTHLERGCLALAAWDAIAEADAACADASEDAVTHCIGAGLGMDLTAAATETTADTSAAPATLGFLQSAGVRFNSMFSRDQGKMNQGLVDKFCLDLGKGFDIVASSDHPPPSFVMDKCLYYDLAHEGGAPSLTRIFWAEHRGAFTSVPGFTFEGDHTVSPHCSFTFTKGDDTAGG